MASNDHRQAAAKLVVPDTPLVDLGSLQIQIEFEPIRTSVVQYTDQVIRSVALAVQCDYFVSHDMQIFNVPMDTFLYDLC